MVTGCYTLTSGSVVKVELGQRLAKTHGNASEARAIGHMLIRTSVEVARKYLCVLASFAKVGIYFLLTYFDRGGGTMLHRRVHCNVFRFPLSLVLTYTDAGFVCFISCLFPDSVSQ